MIPIGPDGTPLNGGQSRPVLKLIVPNVPVAAISAVGSTIGSKSSNVSLRVNDTEAGEIAFSSENGKVWLALRPSAGARSSKPQIVSLETLLLGVRPVTVLHSFGGRR